MSETDPDKSSGYRSAMESAAVAGINSAYAGSNSVLKSGLEDSRKNKNGGRSGTVISSGKQPASHPGNFVPAQTLHNVVDKARSLDGMIDGMYRHPFKALASLLLVNFVAIPVVNEIRHPGYLRHHDPISHPVSHSASHPHRPDFQLPAGYVLSPADPPNNGELARHCGKGPKTFGPPYETFSFYPTIEQDWKNCDHLKNHDLRGAEADLGRDPDKVNQVFGVLPGGVHSDNGACAPGHEVPTSPLGIKGLTHFKCEPIPGERQRGDVAPFDSTGADTLVPLDGTPLAAPQDQQRQGPPAPIERRPPSQKRQGPSN